MSTRETSGLLGHMGGGVRTKWFATHLELLFIFNSDSDSTVTMQVHHLCDAFDNNDDTAYA